MTTGNLEGVQSFIEGHGFLSWLGVTVETVESGRAVLSVPARDALRNLDDGGPIHGGVVATLVDTASGFALRTTFEDPAEARLTTTDLDVSYLRPATGGLLATAEVVRAGGSMGVVDVSVADADRAASDGESGDEVAVGRTTYRLFREDG